MNVMSAARAGDAREKPQGAPRQRLAHLIARVNRRLEEELGESLREAGLPIEQFRVLEALGEGAALTMGELAEAALVERPTLTKIVDRMVAAGLVFRRPDTRDRRRVHVVASEEGESLRAGLAAAARAQERRLIDSLPPGAAETVRRLLAPLA